VDDTFTLTEAHCFSFGFRVGVRAFAEVSFNGFGGVLSAPRNVASKRR
jgi:hypothetical protein